MCIRVGKTCDVYLLLLFFVSLPCVYVWHCRLCSILCWFMVSVHTRRASTLSHSVDFVCGWSICFRISISVASYWTHLMLFVLFLWLCIDSPLLQPALLIPSFFVRFSSFVFLLIKAENVNVFCAFSLDLAFALALLRRAVSIVHWCWWCWYWQWWGASASSLHVVVCNCCCQAFFSSSSCSLLFSEFYCCC